MVLSKEEVLVVNCYNWRMINAVSTDSTCKTVKAVGCGNTLSWAREKISGIGAQVSKRRTRRG